MKAKLISILSVITLLAIFIALLSSCNKEDEDSLIKVTDSPTQFGSLTDIDGHVYKTVVIGTQTWMAENLRVEHYRNGEEIPWIYTKIDWMKHTSGAYCYTEDWPYTNIAYGNLYNGSAANDPRKLAPAGWHIPSANEWAILLDHLGYEKDALKNSAFKALFTGFLTGNGDYYMKNWGTVWWSSTVAIDEPGFIYVMGYFSDAARIGAFYTGCGLSVRCVKD